MNLRKPKPARSAHLSRLTSALAIAVLLCSALVSASLINPGVANACTNTPDAAQGTDTQTVTIPSTGTYYLWSRILAPDTTNNSYYLQVDGGCAIDVGDSPSIPANAWTWVNYQDGSTSSVTSLSLAAGNHQIVMTGREPGVEVDRLLFLSDSSCIPTGTGDNCLTVTPPPDTTPPTTTISSGPASSTTSTSASFAFTGQDNVTPAGSLSFQCQLDGGAYAACTSPKAYTGLAVGSHTFNVRATDAAGNTDPTPATQSWAITSTTAIAGDINGDGVVNVLDLSVLLSHYGTNYAPADLNHDNIVNIFDLSILLGNYGK